MRDDELMRCASAFGTPLYTYDERELRSRVAFLREHLPEHVELCYAMKANTFVVPELQKIVDGFEVCSPGELRICGELASPRSQLVISGVYKDEAMIDALVGQDAPVRSYTSSPRHSSVRSSRLPDVTAGGARCFSASRAARQFGMDAPVIKDIVRDYASDPRWTSWHPVLLGDAEGLPQASLS